MDFPQCSTSFSHSTSSHREEMTFMLPKFKTSILTKHWGKITLPWEKRGKDQWENYGIREGEFESKKRNCPQVDQRWETVFSNALFICQRLSTQSYTLRCRHRHHWTNKAHCHPFQPTILSRIFHIWCRYNFSCLNLRNMSSASKQNSYRQPKAEIDHSRRWRGRVGGGHVFH